MAPRSRNAFLLLVLAQAAHSVEEYLAWLVVLARDEQVLRTSPS